MGKHQPRKEIIHLKGACPIPICMERGEKMVLRTRKGGYNQLVLTKKNSLGFVLRAEVKRKKKKKKKKGGQVAAPREKEQSREEKGVEAIIAQEERTSS